MHFLLPSVPDSSHDNIYIMSFKYKKIYNPPDNPTARHSVNSDIKRLARFLGLRSICKKGFVSYFCSYLYLCCCCCFYPRATRAHGRGVISSTNTSGRRLPDYLQICILVYMYTHHVNVIHICTHKLS